MGTKNKLDEALRPKNKIAQQMARLRAKSLTPERRREIASIAGKASAAKKATERASVRQ